MNRYHHFPEYRLTSDDNVIYVFGISPLSQVMVDSILIANVEKAAFRSSEKSGEILDSISFRGRINDTEHFFQMILDQLHYVSFMGSLNAPFSSFKRIWFLKRRS
jgi:hypothetical protein